MTRLATVVLFTVLAATAGAPATRAEGWSTGEAAGAWVGVSVETNGRYVPLYAAPDGSGRRYLEAHEGAHYALVLSNRTRERLGVAVTVDGLNVISGERDAGHGRMYVLGPWEATTVHGWRSSLHEVRRFTFVDERASYAARTGKANGRMGWIEISVFREDRPRVRRPLRPLSGDEPVDRTMAPEARSSDEEATSRPAAPGRDADERTADAASPAPSGEGAVKAERRPREAAPSAGGSFPGTGWGERAYDPVTLVDFRPEPGPTEQVTLRYEYASTLAALGVFPRPTPRDRLRERERGFDGFAPPPPF
jgi:hypothetical protein